MATKKKSFDAVAESRRWRRASSKRLNKMTPEEQLAYLNSRTVNSPGDLRDLNAAITRNKNKPGVTWSKAKASLGLE